MIVCPACKYDVNEWKNDILKKIRKIDTNQELLEEIELLASDTIEYLRGENNGKGTQALIGHDKIFRGFIVKDWFAGDLTQKRYLQANKVIVKISVIHYSKY